MSSAIRAWPLLLGAVVSCAPDPWFEVDARPIALLRAPLRTDDPTPGALLARLAGPENRLMVLDTGAVLSELRTRPCSETDGQGWLFRGDLSVIDALHPSQPVRAIFRDIDLFDFCLGAVGSELVRPVGIIGGTVLGNFSVEFVLPSATAEAAPTVSFRRGLPGGHEAWEISGYSVLGFRLESKVMVTTPSRDKTLEVGVDTVVLPACAAPAAFTGQEMLNACPTNAAAATAGTGVDLNLALATGMGPTVLGESAWRRVAVALGVPADQGLRAPLHVPSSPEPIDALWVTVPRLALVNDQAGELSPCSELARSRRLQSAHARAASGQQGACLEECDAGRGTLITAAYLELGGALPVAVVKDSSRVILDVNPNLPFDTYVDGILGMSALTGTRFEMDYLSRPAARLVTRCEPGSLRSTCFNVGRCIRETDSSDPQGCFGQTLVLPRCRTLAAR